MNTQTSQNPPQKKKTPGKFARKIVDRKLDLSSESPLIPAEYNRKVVVQNLGPISKAELRLKPLTVFAGPNKTGKTFVSKSLYSVFRAINDNHAGVLCEEYSKKIQDAARRLRETMPAHIRRSWMMRPHSRSGNGDSARFLEFFPGINGRLRVIRKKASSMPQDWRSDEYFEEVVNIAADLTSECQALAAFYRENETAIVAARSAQDAANELKNALFALADIRWADVESVVSRGLPLALYQRIVANFQTHAEFLPKGMKGAAGIEIEDIPKFEISNRGVECPHDGNFLLWSERAPIFLEFPGAYWKLRDALESMRFGLLARMPRELDSVPQYFYDLAETLKRKDFPPSQFPELHRHLENVIGGKIVLSETGELLFHDRMLKEPHPMHTTAAGVINLGMLSFLIEKARIDGNSLVFIDEPEINLHPRWQREMADALARLVNGGVHVVVATHSDWLLDSIANLVRQGETNSENESSLKEDEVGVYWFEPGKNGKGSKAIPQTFDNDNGYLPKDVRKESTDLYNKTVPLQTALDKVRG